jgi:hypothetical protein
MQYQSQKINHELNGEDQAHSVLSGQNFAGMWVGPAPGKHLRCCEGLPVCGGRLMWHARYYWLSLAEGHLHRRLFGQMLRRIWALPVPSG